jgi:hypothetical protein
MSIVDGVATVYLGDYYEYEAGTGITHSYYGSGTAMRIVGASDPQANGVFYLLKDHASTADLRSALSTGLGSTNLTIDSAGDLVSEIRYMALRFHSG